MAGINVGRWLLGGVVAAVIIFVLEGLGGLLYNADMTAALEQHGLEMSMSTGTMLLMALISLLAGLVLVFVYALARARFGPGPRTAVIAALVMWFGGYLLTVVGYSVLAIFPSSMLLLWAALGLVELIVAALAGAWLYQESAAQA